MAQSRSKSSKGRSKNQSRKTNAENKNTQEQLPPQIAAEVAGVIWMAAGLLLALFLYVITKSWLGGIVSYFAYGMIGFAGYLLPVICIFVGVTCFLRRTFHVKALFYVTIGLFLLVIMTFINVNALEAEGISFWKYIGNAYLKSGASHGYGGFVGALFAYPLVRLCSKAGAVIILIALFVILCLVTFRVSIVAAISDLHKRNVEKRAERKRLMDELDEEDDYDDEFLSDDDDEEEPEPISFLDDLDGKAQNLGDVNFELPSVMTPDSVQDDVLESDLAIGEISDGHERIEYQRPPYSLLKENTTTTYATAEEAERQGRALIAALASFGIQITISHISIGPTVTRFEIQLAEGVRIRSITSLNQDIALALAAEKVRIEAPIPGKQAIGIEIPNKQTSYVYLREILESKEFRDSASPLTIAIGKDIVGKIVVADIMKMPHLMIAGSTGSGKSVCLNSIITSLVYKTSPEDLRLILIDPKIVEFSMYAELPHLLIPVVTDNKKAASSLKWAVAEMEKRYQNFSRHNVKNITDFNAAPPEGEEKVPRIVIIIDELAELMMSSAKEVEDYITRIAQLGRACGIHLIVATQRPSVDIITGKIKANIISRIAFAVSDAMNSKVILDATGAECLIGNGDMLFHPSGTGKSKRVQCAYISDHEVYGVIQFFKEHYGVPSFDDLADSQISAGVTSGDAETADDSNMDELFIDAARTVIETKRASTSLIQQRFRIGYNRASRIMNDMEKYGIVTPLDIKKERKVIVDMMQFERMFSLGGYADIPAKSTTVE